MAADAPHSLPPAIFVVGPTCTGKSEAGRCLNSAGFRWIEPSKFLVEHVPLDLPLMDRLRTIDEFFRSNGPDYVAKRMLTEALAGPSQPLVITGCRQLVERDILAGRFRSVVIALHSSTRIRYERTMLRARRDLAPDYATFVRASAWEYSLGLGRLVYEADTIIENDRTLPDLHAELARWTLVEPRP